MVGASTSSTSSVASARFVYAIVLITAIGFAVPVGAGATVETRVEALAVLVDAGADFETELVLAAADDLVVTGAAAGVLLAAADDDATGALVPEPLIPPFAPVAAMRASASAWVSHVVDVPAEFTSGSAVDTRY
jgi:hypothetical protein